MMWFSLLGFFAIASAAPVTSPFPLTGELIVRLSPDADPRVLRDLGVVQPLGGDPEVVLFSPNADVDLTRLARQLTQRADVVWAEPDMLLPVVSHDLPNDPMVTAQWHLENTGQGDRTPGIDINAEQAWAVATGEGAIVSVIDSGMDVDHPDLIATPGYDFVDDDPDPRPPDQNNHGTAVGGIIAGVGDNGIGVAGVAYDAELYGVRLINGESVELSSIYQALVQSVDAGAWVINNSWGIPDCPRYATPSVINDAFTYAETQGRGGLGAAVVFAAGNSNCDGTEDGMIKHPLVVGVAASTDRDVRAGYSNFGAIIDVSGPTGGLVTTDISGETGPGGFQGDVDYVGNFSGTSGAAPVVSGVLTLMFSANDRLTAAQAREILCESSVRIDVDDGGYDQVGWSPFYGCGRIDAGAAVWAVANIGGPDQTTPAPTFAEAYVERVLLQWEPATDPDNDWLRYEVTWWSGDAVDDATITEVDGLTLDLTGEVEVGDTVTWTVRALDAWGPGADSDPNTFTVVATPVAPTPEPQGGCATAGGRRTGLAWGALALLTLVTRRRRPAAR